MFNSSEKEVGLYLKNCDDKNFYESHHLALILKYLNA